MNIDPTISAAAIATLVSALTSSVISLRIARRNQYKSLCDQLDSILKIAVQYPYLESERFTGLWSPEFDRNDEKFLRYDVYCTLVFNFLCGVAEHYSYDRSKIEKFIAIKDWVRLHGLYWQNPTSSYENVDSYDKEFIELINGYLK